MILTTSKKTFEVWRIIATWPGISIKEIADETGENEATIRNHIETLIEIEMLRMEKVYGVSHFWAGDAIADMYSLVLKSITNEAMTSVARMKRMTSNFNLSGFKQEKIEEQENLIIEVTNHD